MKMKTSTSSTYCDYNLNLNNLSEHNNNNKKEEEEAYFTHQMCTERNCSISLKYT